MLWIIAYSDLSSTSLLINTDFVLDSKISSIFYPQIREQMSVPDLYIVTVAFLALKKWFFWDNFFFQKFFWKILTLFYATFQCGRYNVKKIQKKIFFAHEKLKKTPKKVAQNRPRPLFPTNQPRPQPTAQNWFSISWNFGTRHLFSYLCCTVQWNVFSFYFRIREIWIRWNFR